MELSPEAQEALSRIKTIREQLPDCESTQNAEAKLLRKLRLEEVTDIALALQEWETSNE
jgi:hypothetical protein